MLIEFFIFSIKCGIPDDEEVDINGVLLRKRRQSKESEKLQKHINTLEDEKLSLKGEIQKLNRKLSVLSSQILDSGGKLSIDTETETNDSTSIKLVKQDSKQGREKELLEENEALRKGLHEILESVQAKNGKYLQRNHKLCGL